MTDDMKEAHGPDLFLGIGTDVIEMERVGRSVAKNAGFKEWVFTENEITYCEGKADKALHYAARYAAKEAFLKALGTGWQSPLKFDEIEIIHDALGRPGMVLHGATKEIARESGITHIHVSISHITHIVNAVVLLQKAKDKGQINIYSEFLEIDGVQGGHRATGD